MSEENTVYAFTASEDISQLNAVKITGDFTVGIATAATDKVIGVALEGVASGKNVPIALIGDVLHGYAGGTITAGDFLVPTTGGDVIVEATSGQPYLFIAITSASADEEVQFVPYKGTIA